MEPSQILDLLKTGTVASLLLVIIVGGYKKIWIFGWVHEQSIGNLKALYNDRIADLCEDRDQWKNVALRTLHLAETATDSNNSKAR